MNVEDFKELKKSLKKIEDDEGYDLSSLVEDCDEAIEKMSSGVIISSDPVSGNKYHRVREGSSDSSRCSTAFPQGTSLVLEETAIERGYEPCKRPACFGDSEDDSEEPKMGPQSIEELEKEVEIIRKIRESGEKEDSEDG